MIITPNKISPPKRDNMQGRLTHGQWYAISLGFRARIYQKALKKDPTLPRLEIYCVLVS